MAFTLTLLSDVRGWLKGTGDVEQSLDQLADSLDDLARDTASSSEEAGDKLATDFTDAFDKVKREAKDTGRKIGDDINDGARRAGEGVETFRDEGKQSIRETAASFSDVEDALDLVQEVAANAFQGFGPAGMAAGAAAAIGIGLANAALQDATDKANAAKDEVVDLAKELTEVHGNVALIQWADRLKDKLLEIADQNAWQTFWNDQPKAKLQEWTNAANRFGVDMHDVARMITGDQQAQARVSDQLSAKYLELGRHVDAYGENNSRAMGDLQQFRAELEQQSGQITRAADLNKLWEESLGPVATALDAAAEASGSFSESLTDNLSVADEGLEKFVKKGKLSIEAWTEELNHRAEQNTRIKDFMVDVDTELSPEAMNNFAKLPVETQDQIAKAYRDGDKGDRKKIRTNLEAEAKIDKVTIDASGIQVEAEKSTVEIPSTVVSSGAVKGTADAADAAQREANRPANVIEFQTKVDRDDLQRQVDRAAAAIVPPTITVRIKVPKEVP